MNILFAHIPLASMIYGMILAVAGIMFIHRINTGQWLHVLISVAVLYILFSMHGEQADTRMGAALAAIVIDMYVAYLLRTK